MLRKMKMTIKKSCVTSVLSSVIMRWQTSSETSNRKSAGAYNQLCNLVEKSGVLSETILNLLELLKTALPVKLTDADKKTLQNELHAIADNAVSKIRKEHERVGNDIRRNASRIPLTPTTFWCMVALLILLSTFFAIVVFANVKLLHTGILAEIIVIYSVLIVLILIAIAFTYSQKQQ